jgi:hypothetical protein
MKNFCVSKHNTVGAQMRCVGNYSHNRGRDEWSTSCGGPFNKGKELPLLTGHVTASLGTLVKQKSNLSYADYSQAPP